MPKITIYSTATCAFCHLLTDYLDQHKIAYEVKRADLDQRLAIELLQKSGQLGVPFSIVEQNDGSTVGILGFNKPKFDEVLGLA